MQINSVNKLNFGGLYISKDISGYQKYIAHNVSKKLSSKNHQGISYLSEIKNMGYDVLLIKTEFDEPDRLRLCIIRDMKSKRLPDGEYDFLDAKPISETGMYFCPDEFVSKISDKQNSKFLKKINDVIIKIFK